MSTNFKKIFFLFAVLSLLRIQGAVAQELSAEKIVQKNADSIVLVAALTSQGTSFGSGFIISEDGLVVTNYHVIKNAINIGVKLRNNKKYENVALAHIEEKKDVAILKIQKGAFQPVKLGDSSRVKIGERIVAIGNPLGLENTVSDGLVSSVRDAGKGLKVLQITAPISPGSSGCPLFNAKGEVIGIAVGTNVDGQNINFAIPINYAKRLLESGKGRVTSTRRPAEASSKSFTIYTVRRNDTLFDIARRFDTNVNRLMKLNGLSDATIFVGQALTVPKPR